MEGLDLLVKNFKYVINNIVIYVVSSKIWNYISFFMYKPSKYMTKIKRNFSGHMLIKKFWFIPIISWTLKNQYHSLSWNKFIKSRCLASRDSLLLILYSDIDYNVLLFNEISQCNEKYTLSIEDACQVSIFSSDLWSKFKKWMFWKWNIHYFSGYMQML